MQNESRLWRISGILCAVLTATAAAFAYIKLGIAGVVVDHLLNIASNCGAESAAGGLGAGAGALGCDEGSGTVGAGAVASNDDLSIPRRDTRSGDAYDRVQQYRDQLNRRRSQQQERANEQRHNSAEDTNPSSTSDTAPKKNSELPADTVDFPNQRQV